MKGLILIRLAFLVTRSSYWYQDICPCDLDHLWNRPLSGAFVFHKHILLYPTQRVAEGINMFLTRLSVSQSVSQSVSPLVLFFLSAQLH